MADVPVAFDTLRAATKLRDEGGFTEDQARVLVVTFADALVENLPTRQDLAALATKADVAALRKDHATLRGDLERTEATLRGELKETESSLRNELRETESSLRGEIVELRGDLEKTDLALRGEITELRGDLEKTDSALRGEFTKLRGEISKVQERLTLRMGAAVGTGVAILAVLNKIL